MGSHRVILLTTVSNILLCVAILVFAIGFFPHKAVLPGLASWTEEAAASAADAPFDRLIFMVVDALRSDFVYGNASNFLFTQDLIRSGAAVPFTGHASPPTITMPKVKAITTGSVPSFIDLILNFAESDTTSTLSNQDSWLAQMKAKPEGKLVMFGDDTWLRLFPGFFERTDGTTSFFVSDFTEVDHNVTRNVATELERHDWSAMIFHYLGLDHIGHKTGPQGPNMPAKQMEMDGIVQTVYTAMCEKTHLQNTLLVLLGDHGMNEAGNHGASSAGETSTALTFISPKFKLNFKGSPSPVLGTDSFRYYDVVEQSDIAASLAALLGFPIPKNSLGIVIPRLLNLWPSESDRLNLLYMNAEQIKKIASATFPDAFSSSSIEVCQSQNVLGEEQELACHWNEVLRIRQSGTKSAAEISKATENVQKFLKSAQILLSSAASQYDLSKMSIGICLSLSAFIFAFSAVGSHIYRGGLAGAFFALTLILYAVTMFASSYVEEEHQFWYWITSAWLICLMVKFRRFDSLSSFTMVAGRVGVCIMFGISRRWNQTGQKYAGDPDVVTEILSTSPWLLWTLILGTYAFISRRISRKATRWGLRQMAFIPALVTVSAFLFKLTFTAADAPELLKKITIFDSTLVFTSKYSLVGIARIVFLGLMHMVLSALFFETPWAGFEHKRSFLVIIHDLLSMSLVTQSRTVNVPLFAIYLTQAVLMKSCQPSDGLELTLTSLMFQYSSFFAFGGTNAISSVDLSNAYNGVSGYNVAAVGVLTFLSNWAGPVWWSSATFCLLGRNRANSDANFASYHFATLTLFATGSTLAVMLACMVLREHLFIWTVFSPRYLYSLAWIFGQHFVINGIFGSLLMGY